jgi:hypothetical protein
MAPSFRVRRLGLILVTSALAASGLFAKPASAAASAQDRPIVLLSGTVELDPLLEEAIMAALSASRPLLGEAAYFAATDLRSADGWALASVVGLTEIAADQSWYAEDGSWFGLILAHEIETGIWEAGVQGSDPYFSMLSEVPSTVYEPREASALDPRLALRAAASPTIFPWQSGTAMIYGPLGIHDGGSGWKAVDMATDGNTSAGHSPGIAVAAQPGTIDYICRDGITVTIRMGGFLYAHLLDNTGLYAGRRFAQGEELGQLKSGNFSAACGYGYQPSNWAHLHWAFPDADLSVEAWTLSMSSGLWTDGTTTVAPGSGWIMARAPSAPVGTTSLFDDVPVVGQEWMEPWILAFYSSGMTTGCGSSPLIYCPEITVTRAEMAVFMLRARHGSGYAPPAASHYFADMPVTGREWMEPWIDQYYREGMTTGCGGGNYCPDSNVTRAEMAVFVLRALYGGSYGPPASSSVFADVPVAGKEWMEPWIIQFYNEGITTGCGGDNYCPENNVTRAEMAVFIGRAYDLYP